MNDQRKAANFFEQAGCQSGQLVLDIGFRDLKELQAIASVVGVTGQVVGIDINPTHVQAASKEITSKSLTNISVKEGSILSIPADDQTFDLVLCKGILHEVKRLDTALGELARVCKQGGVISIIDMQRFSRFKFHLYRFWSRLKGMDTGDIHPGFTHEQLATLLAEHQLQEENYQPLEFTWTLGFNKVRTFLLQTSRQNTSLIQHEDKRRLSRNLKCEAN